MPRTAQTKTNRKVATKTVVRKVTKRRRFYEPKCPEIPFWFFLTFGILVLVGIFVAKQMGFPEIVKLAPSPITPTVPTNPSSPTTTLTVTEPALTPISVMVKEAREPRLTTLNDKIYLIFKNQNGGYSVNTYDTDLNQIGITQWLTNGLVIPNQKTATPMYLDGRWYIAYLGGDGFTRLGNYDANWNRQREITFASALKFDGIPNLTMSSDGNLVNIKIYDGMTKHFFSATKDLGLSADEDRSRENWPTTACPVTKLTINDATYQVTSDEVSSTLSRS